MSGTMNVIAAIIESNDGKSILIQDHVKNQQLTIPCGKVDLGEKLDAALAREMWEELGIVVEIDGLNQVSAESNYYSSHGTCIETIFKVKDYLGTVQNVEPEKHKFVKFITYEDIVMSPGAKSNFLKAALRLKGYVC